MKCAEVIDWMQRELDYDLTEFEQKQLKEHVDGCLECAEMYRRLKHISSELEMLPKVTPAFNLVDAILPRIELQDGLPEATATSESEQALPRSSKRIKGFSSKQWGGIVAASLLLAFGIYYYSPIGAGVDSKPIAADTAKPAAKVSKSDSHQQYGIAAMPEPNESSESSNSDTAKNSSLALAAPHSAQQDTQMGIASSQERELLTSPNGQMTAFINGQQVLVQNHEGKTIFTSKLWEAQYKLSLQSWSEDSQRFIYLVTDLANEQSPQEWEIDWRNQTESKLSR